MRSLQNCASKANLSGQTCTVQAVTALCGRAGVFGDWRMTLVVLSLILLLSVALYLAGSCVRGRDYRVHACAATAAAKVLPYSRL